MASRNKSGFVATNQANRLSIGYLGSATHHDPMFTTVMMHLQRQSGPWPYYDTFNFEARPLFQDCVRPPRPSDSTVYAIRLMLAVLELFHHFAHILSSVSMCNENSVSCINNNKVRNTNGRHRAPLTLNIGTLCINKDRLAGGPVTLSIRLDQRTKRTPRSNITPVKVCRLGLRLNWSAPWSCVIDRYICQRTKVLAAKLPLQHSAGFADLAGFEAGNCPRQKLRRM